MTLNAIEVSSRGAHSVVDWLVVTAKETVLLIATADNSIFLIRFAADEQTF